MKVLVTKVVIAAAITFGAACFVNAQAEAPKNVVTGIYRAIDVQKLRVEPDVNIPSNQINVIFLEIVDELYKLKKFDRITKIGLDDAPIATTAGEPKLRLEGTIARYFALIPQKPEGGDIGTRVKLKVKFIDAADGRVLLENEIDRRIYFGVYQFTLEDVGRKIAKDVAKLAKNTFF